MDENTEVKSAVIDDPGQEEGAKRDPRLEQDNIAPDSPRFREVYGKWKSTERDMETLKKDLEELKKAASSKDSLIEEMRRWNEQLAESVKGAVETVGGVRAEDRAEDNITTIQASIEVLKEDYAKALEEGRIKEAADINDKIIDLKTELRELKKAPLPTNVSAPSNDGNVPPEMKPYMEFIETVPWYYENPEMAAYAMQIEAAINMNPKWTGRSVKDKLAEVRRITEERFGWKAQGQQEKRAGAAAVEGGNSFISGGPSSSSQLTPQEMEVCRGLNISPEKFLAQKALVQPRRRSR